MVQPNIVIALILIILMVIFSIAIVVVCRNAGLNRYDTLYDEESMSGPPSHLPGPKPTTPYATHFRPHGTVVAEQSSLPHGLIGHPPSKPSKPSKPGSYGPLQDDHGETQASVDSRDT
ncbi:hypothetical protein BGW36DRAFT_432068 [Talaromyces proteolyticus]|uniref:Uncharacterized protein n=1 Tax=Talaromyces proteolyticus TaxID=1131652 RepID=A0AAD4KJ69_9EURO|nr:uncharacterized protein BGW36DRAFT_432068 [Talaromyces proteolyticus]KAH8691518.1 hypothetical protein BGW36DRAFT_432068 [Talaromyces proteolyticus]